MMRSRLLAIVATAGLLAPLTGIAQSYMSPEQFLQQNNQDFLMPSGPRGAQWQSEMQAQLSRDRHPSIIQEPWDPVQDNGLPPPVAQQDQSPSVTEVPLVQSAPTYGGLDPVTARLLARLEQQNSLLTSTLQSTAAASGAPLAGSGPASVIAVMAMVIAMAWTLRRARVLERFVREF